MVGKPKTIALMTQQLCDNSVRDKYQMTEKLKFQLISASRLNGFMLITFRYTHNSEQHCHADVLKSKSVFCLSETVKDD